MRADSSRRERFTSVRLALVGNRASFPQQQKPSAGGTSPCRRLFLFWSYVAPELTSLQHSAPARSRSKVLALHFWPLDTPLVQPYEGSFRKWYTSASTITNLEVRNMSIRLALKLMFTMCLLLLGSGFGSGTESAQAQAPAIPGLPELPPGVELPDDVKAQLQKALEASKAFEEASKSRQPPATNKPATPAKPTVPAKPANPTTPAKPVPAAPRVNIPSAPAATTFKRQAVEKSLGKIGEFNFYQRDDKKPRFWVSPNGKRIAYQIEKGINVDGKAYEYKHIIREQDQYIRHFHFSPDSQHTSWVVQLGDGQGEGKGETLVVDGVPEKVGWNFIANHDGGVFSGDSQHIAYTARRYAKGDVEYVLMIDGKEREVFLESPAWNISYTPDNKRVVWAEDVGDHYEVRETSIDGSQPRVDRKYGPAVLTMNFFYGPEGQLGYVAKDPQNQFFVVYDGKDDGLRYKELENVLLSRDGKHLAYVAEPQSFRDVVVIDGKPSPTYGGLESDYVDGTLALSPVGGRSAYAIKKRNSVHAVIDGKEGPGYAGVAAFSFSPDGKRLAYWAAKGGRSIIVADGQESAPYDEVGWPTFSPDGQTLAYRAGTAAQKFVVVNGKPQAAYTSIGQPKFSPDGKRLVYVADLSKEGPTLLVDSGKAGKQYANILEPLYFSEQGERLAMVVSTGDHDMVVVDGVEGNPYDLVITLGGGKVQFEGADRFHYLAVKDGELLLVEETIEL